MTPPVCRKRQIVFQVILIGHLLAFVVLAYLAKSIAYFPFDRVITKTVQTISNPFFDQLMRLMTALGFTFWGSVTVLVAGIGLAALKWFKELVTFVISVLGSYVLGILLKVLVNRPRPPSDLVKQLGGPLADSGFPSNHVLFFIGLYGFLLFVTYSKFRPGLTRTLLMIFFSAMIFLVSLSRIYLGAHWFSDVLGSYLIGVVWLYVVAYLYHKL